MGKLTQDEKAYRGFVKRRLGRTLFRTSGGSRRVGRGWKINLHDVGTATDLHNALLAQLTYLEPNKGVHIAQRYICRNCLPPLDFIPN